MSSVTEETGGWPAVSDGPALVSSWLLTSSVGDISMISNVNMGDEKSH